MIFQIPKLLLLNITIIIILILLTCACSSPYIHDHRHHLNELWILKEPKEINKTSINYLSLIWKWEFAYQL